MNLRCDPKRASQGLDESYVGCSNGFTDFQEFVEWHRSKIGYGQGFQVDKDLLVKGNKVYSPTTCSLIPGRVNRFLTNSTSSSRSLPLGVVFDKERRLYIANCSRAEGGNKFLGRFATPEDAFAAYKTFKEAALKVLAEEWRDRLEPQYYEALINFEITPY